MPNDNEMTRPERPHVVRDGDWRTREYRACRSAPSLVWQCEDWWMDREARAIERHWARPSATQPGMIVYTMDADKGERDIQTIIKPGRYLSRYFGDVLTPKQIAYFAAWQATGVKVSGYDDASAYPLHLAHDADDIVDVYARGPKSCMHGEDCVRVYAAGDLAIAYFNGIGDQDGKVIARALVWPDRKVVGRIYPQPDYWSEEGFPSRQDSLDCAESLLNRMRALGYKSTYEGEATFNGARITKEECCEGFVMPYLDQGYGVADHGGHFTMNCRDYDYLADNTCGYIETNTQNCENCGDGIHRDEDTITVYTSWSHRRGARGEQTWCGSCVESHSFWCEATEETYSTGSFGCTYIEGLCETVNDGWRDHYCYQSDQSGDWFVTADDPPHERNNDEMWSTSENDDDPEYDDDETDTSPALPCDPSDTRQASPSLDAVAA